MTNNPILAADTAKPDAVVTPVPAQTPPATNQKPDADKSAVTK